MRRLQLRRIVCFLSLQDLIDTSAYGSKTQYCDFHFYPSSKMCFCFENTCF